ncbi:hypothetical protein ACHAXM_007762 [Skeletonema potamos]
MYLNATKPERRTSGKSPAHRHHHHHHSSPALTSGQEVVIDDSRYPASPQQRYEEMDYRIHHRSVESPYNQQHRTSGEGELYNLLSRDHPLPSISPTSSPSSEVSVQNPTQLFQFMNRHLWAHAMKHLQLHPSDAKVWITSSAHRNLPLHLACLMLDSSARGEPPPPPLHFMEALIHAYPNAAAEKNSEGSLPLHLASECLDITSRYFESEGILMLLSKVYPAGLTEKDKEGRVPMQILEERGIASNGGKIGKSGIIRYMKSQTKIRSRSEETELGKHYNDPNENYRNGFVTPPKQVQTVDTQKSAKRYNETMSTPMSDRHSRSANQSPSPSQYRGYDLLSTPATKPHGYDLISTPAHNFHVESSPRTNIPPSYHKETRGVTTEDRMHPSPRPSEYVLMSPRLVSSPHSHVSASRVLEPTPPNNPPHSNNSIEIDVKLQMMEAKYAQLRSEYDNLNAIHSGTVLELNEQSSRVEESQHRINVLNESVNSVTRLNIELESRNIELGEKLSQQMNAQAELKEELNERTKQLQEMRTRESSLLQQLLKKLESDEERLNREKSDVVTKEEGAFAAKNILLRDVALKAIETVGKLSVKGGTSDHSSQIPAKDELKQLGEAVDLASTSVRVSSQQRNSHLKAHETLKMLHPVIEDAQKMQKGIISKVQQLLHLCKMTTRLIDGIPKMSQDDFDFELTLQALAQVMTVNIDLGQTMDMGQNTAEQMLNNIASVTKQSPAEIAFSLPSEAGDGNTKALLEVVEVTQKTSKKLESLTRTISQLNFSEMNLKEEDMKKCLKATDEITKVFRLSLDHLTRDAKKIRGIADAAISAHKSYE